MAALRDLPIGPWSRRFGLAAGVCASIGLGVHLYDTHQGLRLRAALGQERAQLDMASHAYQAGEIAAAFDTLEPLMTGNYQPAVEIVCDLLDRRQGHPAQGDCGGEASVERRLEQLSDLAFYAREWAVLDRLLARRVTEGDGRAYFDLARFEAQSRPEALQLDAIETHLIASARAGDPRGQYLLAVYQLREIADEAARQPFVQTFARLVSQSTPIDDGDAYFELAKLMQAGLIDSDLAYAEVLERADRLGNRYAASHMAQYLMANPEIDTVGGRDADRWVEIAAANGDPVAQYNHALHLLEAPSTEAATDAAERLLRRSAETGFAPAHTRLAALLWQQPLRAGADAESGREEALRHWRAAADKGDANALYNLGQIARAQGDGDAAARLLAAAARRGSEAAAAAPETTR